MLKGKTVILGVSGGIAAYKIASLASMLKKKSCDVHVIMTQNATNFITQATFEALTGNKCIVDTFDRDHEWDVKHVSLAKRADFVMVAPATANVIAKLSNGIADDMLTTTILACKCPIAVAPAMNTRMFENAIVQDNIKKLEHYGFDVIMPAVGYLACGDTGAGKMPEPEELYAHIEKALAFEKDLLGKKVLVTAGATQEAIDPVRYITNHSTGKMGYAIAQAAMLRGAEVTLVSGRTALDKPRFMNFVQVVSAQDMFEAVAQYAPESDIIIKSAAVADYTPVCVADNKIKKKDGDMSIPLKRTTDILAHLGSTRRDDQFICGFSMETENMLENSRAKLKKKNVDMIAANNLKVEGAGFGVDTNVLTLITADEEIQLELMDKQKAAHKILDEIIRITK
ncbi:MAG: bifunctional phosphopantothenoylcysteine decarboxylase/phosphopantothenate--cysteine ligase CoaBC [Clostridia bacterium]|nr:bifunctional phosphopantothenoylcysteine decarboxylase/phosphopantothenate--cysteine ligase CoaBC [Clostridia bacterium]